MSELIYRQDVIARLKKAEYVFRQNEATLEATGIHYALELVESYYEIPTIEPRKEPQGEWIHREDMDYVDENNVIHNHFMCDKCGLIHDFIDGHTSQYNFCPQCGSKMGFKS